ncbi:sensor histidine kinase [Mucilaginibacter terrae]|uniref:sensor histidine kinase n=1 Tax=Mucilaginibacter terrae TaxID=1955052 RepID=UPI00362D1D0A
MNKLLNRTIQPIALYSLFVLGLSIPVYYLIVDLIWINELDKHHYALRTKIETRFNKLNLPDTTIMQTIAIWNKIEPGIIFSKTEDNRIKRDSTYSIIRYDDFMHDREQFRCLVTYVKINGMVYRLLVQTNMEEQDETIMFIAFAAVLFLMLLLGGIILLMRRIAINLWRPFYHTLDQLKLFNLHSLTSPAFRHSDIQEFEQLNNSLRELIKENITVFKQQKEFTENASHELQTPLSIVQSQLDLLLQSRSLTQEQLSGIENAGRALARVSRINKNLLLMAKIENHQYAQSERIDLSQVLMELTQALQEHTANKQLIFLQYIEPLVLIISNLSLTEILLTNLFINAINHNVHNGSITISLVPGKLTFANTGSYPLNEEKLFKRFSSVSNQAKGSGLGLAIVKQIAGLYNWQIAYHFKDSQHIFTLIF